MLALLATCLLLLPQEDPGTPASSFERILELEISADDPQLIDDWGPTVVVEYEAEFTGTLYVWTRSRLDLFLRVEDVAENVELVADDNSGGGTTPFAAIPVKAGDNLSVMLAARSGESDRVELHLIEFPETDRTRKGADELRRLLEQARERQESGELIEARAVVEGIAEGFQDGGARHGPAEIELARKAVFLAYELNVAETRSLEEAVVEAYERCLPRGHPKLLGARSNLANSLDRQGDLAGARALCEAVLEAGERSLPSDHPYMLATRNNLAGMLQKQGDLAGARTMFEDVLEACERSLPPDHPKVLTSRLNLAGVLRRQGDLSGARALQEAVLEVRERSLPSDHPDLLTSRRNLASTMRDLGDLAGARALLEAVLEAAERVLPPDHPDLLTAQFSLGNTLSLQGDFIGSRTLFQAVLEAYERSLPSDHPDLLAAQDSLAGALAEQGDLAGARALQESALEALGRSLPPDHPTLLVARFNLAVTLFELGDLTGARRLQEAVLAAYERSLPADHHNLLAVRFNLAVTCHRQGDLAGARAVQEAVLEAIERSLPPDHPSVIACRAGLAQTLLGLGDLGGARALLEDVLEACERTLPPDHPQLLRARHSLAATLRQQGDPAGAQVLEEAVLEAYEQSLPPDHPLLLGARLNLAGRLVEQGDLAGARALQEAVLAAYERSLPPDNPDMLAAQNNLAMTLYRLGEPPDLAGLLAGLRARLSGALLLSAREQCEIVRDVVARYFMGYFMTASEPLAQRKLFELQEQLRLISGESLRRLAGHNDPEMAEIRQKASQVRGALGALVEVGSTPSPSDRASELLRLSRERDRLERRASARLAELGIMTAEVQLDELSQALEEGAALLAYRVSPAWKMDEETTRIESDGDHLYAHLLSSEGLSERVDLGAVAELEPLINRWRQAIRAPVGPGVSKTSTDEAATRRLGEVVRARLLDPLLSRLPEQTRQLHVCGDDLVFLVPLDALPFEKGCVGDRWSVVNEVSVARLLKPRTDPPSASGFLVVGGLDYDAEEDVEVVGTAMASLDRSAFPERFQYLPDSAVEAESLQALHDKMREVEASLMSGHDATKEALTAEAAGKRFVHLATHGWFAPETMRSVLDEPEELVAWQPLGLEEQAVGLAPMLLCGLAISGANQGRDSLGRLPGILTAEELCTLDLSQCDLAVLSGCQTNVGVRRAGQGIQSLQSALYGAGARTSITSLWRVPDKWSRVLMEELYRNLWERGMGKAEALWAAKMSLREQGRPVRDWAGWVLTGAPN